MFVRLKPLQLYTFILAVFFITLCHNQLQAQSTMDHFGKNRIQTKRFDWTYYKTDNFEIFFYKEGSEIARFTALHAEEEFKRISKMIGYAPFGKTRILLYNSHTDLLQSNIGLDDEMAFIGGQTNFVKLNAELAFNGNLIDFKNDISVNIARIYITDLLYGGNIREVYQNALLMNLPDWFVPGAAAYVGRGWSQEMDDFMRDGVTKYRLRNPAKFRGKEAELLGQSIFNYITIHYGEAQMANIISFGRIMRNDREAIENTLNIKYRDFMKEWRKFYVDMADETAREYQNPEKSTRIKKSNYRNVDYNKVKLSPDGKKVAYTQNLKGRYTVKVAKIKKKEFADTTVIQKLSEPEKLSEIDKEFGIQEDSLNTKPVLTQDTIAVKSGEKITFGRKRTIKRGGTNLINQKVNYNIPLIAWKNNNQLSIILKKKNRHILKTYKANGTVKSRIKIYNFNQILDFNWAPDDNFIVLSAERNGQSDIFIYDTRRASTKVITNDMYDDLNPIYQKGTKNLIWSSNRHNDTLGTDIARFKLIGSNLDLFIYNPEISTTVLQRITHSSSDETKPVCYDTKTLAYLSDDKGIINACRLSLEDSNYTSAQITSNAQSFREFDVNSANNGIAYVSIAKGKERVHFEPLKLSQNLSTSKTSRQLHLEKEFFDDEERVRKNRLEAIKVVEDKLRSEQETEKLETLVDAIMNGTMTDSAISRLAQDTTVNILDLDTVTTETFVFESEKNTLKATSGFYAARQGIKSDKYYLYKTDYQLFAAKGGLWKARHKLGVENTVTSIGFDPLRGMGAVLNLTLADLFNDHRFYGGIFGSTDLRTSNINLEYQYLKKRFDFKFRYEKQRLYISNQSVSFDPSKYTVNKFEVELSYPLTNTLRVSFIPYYMNSRYNYVPPTFPGDPYDRYTHYGSYRFETVYDNTLIVGHNMKEGTKFRLLYDFNYAFLKNDSSFSFDKKQNFGKISLDLRRYQRIHQELILAMRFSGGSFIGPAKKSYLLGGMDSWVTGRSANTGSQDSPLYNEVFMDKRDLLFNKYVTNMRGFLYNQLYGTNHLLLNFEVRWPIIKYFYRGVIGSNFFKNLQIIGFYDVGSAWTGTNPWDKENNFNTITLAPTNNAFSAKVINYRNPWLQGFGPGIRTMFLGYYLKVDLAWGVMDYVVKKPMWHVTLGYDF